jgi:hypothetical protein
MVRGEFPDCFLMLCLQALYLFLMFALQLRHFVEVRLRQSLDSCTSIVAKRLHSFDNDSYIF